MWFYHSQTFRFSAPLCGCPLKDAHIWSQFVCRRYSVSPWWCFSPWSPSNCITWPSSKPLSAKFPQKTLQFQLHQLLRLRHTTKSPPSRLPNIIWHDVINNTLTPHSSNYHNPLSPEALVHTLSTLPCDIVANVYCQRTGSRDVFHLLQQSFPVIHPVKHLLSHRKQHNPSIVQRYRLLHLAIKIELHIFFLLSRHLHHLTSLPKKKSRPNNKRRRTLFRRQQLQQ